MIHRALFGSIERFFAVLLEHYAGAFPLWLAPVQVSVLPVADRHHAYAVRLVDRCKAEGFRAEMLDAHNDTLGNRVRRAKTEKVPYVLVVGDEDADDGTVGRERPRRGAARARGEGRRLRRAARGRSRSSACDPARPALGRVAVGVHLRASRPSRRAGRVLLLRPAGAARRRGDDPRAHRHDVHRDERVPYTSGHVMVAPLAAHGTLVELDPPRRRS